MAETIDDPRVGTVIASYRIEERIGRGGMGVVYRAEHLNLLRRAAIKIIAPDLADSEGFRERFTREARIAAALQHPNIVTVYDAGEVDGLLYLAMQFIQGYDLAAMLRRDGRLRPYRAIDVCRQVASALDAAHAEGLIHRDVKPANVLIEGRTAFLTDFGLTKRVDGGQTDITRAGDVVGTIHYVAPEQIEGGQVSARSDVYSLGCLLYHCLVGQVPFARDNDVAVIYAHLSEDPPRPSTLRPELAGGLDSVIAKALDKSPERRFPSCGDLVSAARAVVDAVGPLSDTSPPRYAREWHDTSPPELATPSDVGSAIAGMRDAAAAARRPRVLLGGLEANTAAVARMALGENVEVLEAARGGGLIERVREGRPDLLVLDWEGAGQPADEVVDILQADPLTRDAKVLLLIEYDQTTNRDVISASADERLAMPFSPLQFQVKVRKMLGDDAVGG